MATPTARIHIAQLDAFDASIGTDWLSADEAARLQAMTAPERRRSFLAGHWLARFAAGEWLGVDPREIVIHQHADGRPCLLPPALAGVSITHSGKWLAVALADVPVGIDVELSERTRNFDALARHAFSATEAARISSIDASDRRAAFHELWTLKEAHGKRTGKGLLPEQSRNITSLTSSAENAEAITWAFEGGSLAIAVEAGTRVEFIGGPEPGTRTHWRFVPETA